MVESQIWNNPNPIAIQADFNTGLQKLYDFLDYCMTQAVDTSKIAAFKQETIAFFNANEDRKLDIFHLEAGEIFDLISDTEPILAQNESLVYEIKSITKDITAILENKPENMFQFSNSGWLQELADDIELLAPYWTHVVFNSFNNSGK